MSIHRRAAKRDANEPEIIEALVRQGAFVSQLSGTGIPDLLVIYQGVVTLIEVKVPKTGRLRTEQITFLNTAADHEVTVHVVTDPQQAIDAIKR